jgi:hypothetical protein
MTRSATPTANPASSDTAMKPACRDARRRKIDRPILPSAALSQIAEARLSPSSDAIRSDHLVPRSDAKHRVS